MIKTELLYRASTHGWYGKDFHREADEKGPTITFFKVKETGLRCGGYTSASWESPVKYKYKSDSTAFLFSLDKKQHFPVKNTNEAIICDSNWGP